MKRTVYFVILLILVLITSGVSRKNVLYSEVSVIQVSVDLRCEYAVNPLGMTPLMDLSNATE